MSDFDGFDAAMVVTGVIITASAPTLLIALPLAIFGFGLHIARRSKGVAEWGDKITGNNNVARNVMPYLLPGPKEDDSMEMTIKQDKPLQVELAPSRRKLSSDDDLRNVPWKDRITGAHNVIDTPILTATSKKIQKTSTAVNMAKVLEKMPTRIRYDNPKLTEAPTPMSVLIGYDPIGKRWVWADFGIRGDTIHAFIGGQTRAGKDSEMRLWFTQLTSNNGPEDIQFIIIDAKGEWITPALKDSRHMAVTPVGGFNLKIERGQTGKRQLRDLAGEAIEDALIDTIEILQKRSDEFQRVGATNLQAYERKTGKHMPILFVLVTDVGTNLNGILEDLVRFLVLKGGSLGVRAIISMQTASGEDTSWRGQMGLAMSGYQGQSSADAPNLGIPVKAMVYRPSELPSVDVPENRGLFVVRKGIEQYVVRGAHLPDDVFEEYCENVLPRKSVKTNRELLGSLLIGQSEQQQIVHVPTATAIATVKPILTKEQAILAAQQARLGVSVSKILTDHLKITNGDRYALAKPHVEIIWRAVNRKRG